MHLLLISVVLTKLCIEQIPSKQWLLWLGITGHWTWMPCDRSTCGSFITGFAWVNLCISPASLKKKNLSITLQLDNNIRLKAYFCKFAVYLGLINIQTKTITLRLIYFGMWCYVFKFLVTDCWPILIPVEVTVERVWLNFIDSPKISATCVKGWIKKFCRAEFGQLYI